MSKPFRTLDEVDVSGKRVLLRVDLNVPTENGRVTDTTRIERVASTITEIADKGGKVIMLAHFGRPKGARDEAYSLRPVAAAVSEVIKRPVAFATDCIGETAAAAIAKLKNGDILLLENTRFYKGEEKNDPASSRSSPSSATSMSTTPSPPRTAPTPRPKASPTSCRLTPAARCRPSSRR